MKLLFVGDRLPVPPRSGWEVPIARLLERVRHQHSVTYLVGAPGGQLTAAQVQRVDAARPLFEDVHVVPLGSVGAGRAAADELLLRRPSYMAHDWDPAAIRAALGDTRFDAVWVAPVAMAGFVSAYRAAFPRQDPRFVLGLNDAIYRSYIEKGMEFFTGTIERDVSSLLRFLRAPLIAVHERRYLQEFDAVHVQTRREASRLERILPRGSRPELVVASNAAEESLLELPYDARRSSGVLFISHLVDGREKQALWFIREVWSRVQEANPDLHLHIHGQPGPPELVRRIEAMGHIHAHGFTPAFGDVFAGRALSVVPIRQTCGLVTKVVDSMAAGVPVVGLRALHTLDGFQNGVHGIAARSGRDLAAAITTLLADPDRRDRMSRTARSFIQEEFAWGRTLDALEASLTAGDTRAAGAGSQVARHGS